MASAEFDVVVIGGGITGAGVFRQALSLGLKTLLLERAGVGGRTTEASSGLVHGGLRYLPYDVGTSILCCRESGRLARLYPSLLRRQVFLWPVYRGERHGIETVEALLEYYDRFAPLKGGKRHVRLSPEEALSLEPGLAARGLLGAVSFDEWAVDAAALARRLIGEGLRMGGEMREQTAVVGFQMEGGAVRGIKLSSPGSGSVVSGRMTINAAGPWAEEIAALAGARMVRLSLRKGVHLIVQGLPVRHGLIFQDLTGRAVGLYPRGNAAWVGPTDDAFEGRAGDPLAVTQEKRMLSESLRRVFPAAVLDGAMTAVGVRPIIRQWLPGPLSRDYRVYDHVREGIENFITVTGGKLTVYRPMAEEAVCLAAAKLGRLRPALPPPPPPFDFYEERIARAGRLFTLAVSASLLAFFAARHAFRRVWRSKGFRQGLELFRRTYGEAG